MVFGRVNLQKVRKMGKYWKTLDNKLPLTHSIFGKVHNMWNVMGISCIIKLIFLSEQVIWLTLRKIMDI